MGLAGLAFQTTLTMNFNQPARRSRVGGGAGRRRRCRQLQILGHLFANDGDRIAGEEAHLEAPLATPPHAFHGGWHVDHRNHITHLHSRVPMVNHTCPASPKCL